MKVLIACMLTMAGVLLELAQRELGGPGPLGMVGGRVADEGLLALGVVPVEGQPLNGAGAVEQVVVALRKCMENDAGGSRVVEG